MDNLFKDGFEKEAMNLKTLRGSYFGGMKGTVKSLLSKSNAQTLKKVRGKPVAFKESIKAKIKAKPEVKAKAKVKPEVKPEVKPTSPGAQVPNSHWQNHKNKYIGGGIGSAAGLGIGLYAKNKNKKNVE